MQHQARGEQHRREGIENDTITDHSGPGRRPGVDVSMATLIAVLPSSLLFMAMFFKLAVLAVLVGFLAPRLFLMGTVGDLVPQVFAGVPILMTLLEHRPVAHTDEALATPVAIVGT